MPRRFLLLTLVALTVGGGPASAQMFNARSMAMGGVVLAGGGPGSDAGNVAYRAVPRAPGTAWGMTLPLGVAQVLADPPQFDPNKSDFNVYEVLNLLYDPPWNYRLVKPSVPGNDIHVSVGQDRLSVDLGSVRDVFPDQSSKAGMVHNGPAFGVGLHGAFVAVAPFLHYQNELSFNDAFHEAIRSGQYRTRTPYSANDDGRAQAAAQAQLGWAGALAGQGDPRGAGQALYAGARVKVLRGLAYGETHGTASFTTSDTLFSQAPVDIGFRSHSYDAGPDGGGWGEGLDLGAVWVGSGLELGLGVNDIGTRIDWRARETVAYNDTSTGEYVQSVVARDRAITSTVPVTVTANAAGRVGRFLVACDVVREVEATVGHLGAETWAGNVALRAGLSLDENRLVQYAGGTGVRFGRFGLDLSLATNSRNVTLERAVDLALGVAFYR